MRRLIGVWRAPRVWGARYTPGISDCAPRPVGTSSRHGMRPGNLWLVCGFCQGRVVDRLRSSGLRHSHGPDGASKAWDGHTGQHEAGQDGDWQRVFLDLLMPDRLTQAKNDMLDLIVYSPARSKGLGLGIRSKVVNIALEQPVGLCLVRSKALAECLAGI